MARQTGLIKFTGKIGPLTGYEMNGDFFVKENSTFSQHRFKNSPVFEKSRRNASIFAMAVHLARIVYYRLTPSQRDQKLVWYPLRNKAQELLRGGMEEKAVLEIIQNEYGKGLEGLPKTTNNPGLEPGLTGNEIRVGKDYRGLDQQIAEQLELVNRLYERILEQKEKTKPQGKPRNKLSQNINQVNHRRPISSS